MLLYVNKRKLRTEPAWSASGMRVLGSLGGRVGRDRKRAESTSNWLTRVTNKGGLLVGKGCNVVLGHNIVLGCKTGLGRMAMGWKEPGNACPGIHELLSSKERDFLRVFPGNLMEKQKQQSDIKVIYP
jgi:hypothetical protein